MRVFSRFLACGLLLGVPGLGLAQSAGADLNISPKRLVFDMATRTASVYIFNRGTAPATYKVELTDRYMRPDGQILPVSEAAGSADTAAVGKVASATTLLTYTPRRVTLEPGQSQTVRVRVLRPAALAAGEYRSHLTVTTLPPEDVGLTAEQAAKPGEGQLAVRLVSLFSVSIPVIVRQGEVAATAGIEGLRLSSAPASPEAAAAGPVATLMIDLKRQGSGSVYGNLVVRSDRDAKSADPIGALGGVAVYPEVDRRSVPLRLKRVPAAGEHLTVTYLDDDHSQGTVLATGALTVP